MPLQPIDVQIMFVRLDDVSRLQAGQQSAVVQNQGAMLDEIERRAWQRHRDVPEPELMEDGPEQVHEDSESSTPESAGNRNHRRGRGRQGEGSSESFRDPSLGNMVDIEG